MKRIGFGFLITLVGIVASWLFLKPSSWTEGLETQEAIAHIEKLTNDVKRQRKGNYLWENLRLGDVVFQGDRIRTGDQSQTVVKLKDSSLINVEQNSLVLMDTQSERVSLNMLEGRIFVKAETEQSLDLQAGGEKIALDGEAALSLDQGQANLSLLSGQLTKTNASGTQEKVEGQDLELTPSYGSVVFVDDEIKVSSSQKLLNPRFFYGINESTMTEVKVLKTDERSFTLSPIFGEYYWKIQTDSFTSPLMRASWKRRIPPSPVFPITDEVLKISELRRGLDFKWMSLTQEEEWVLEVASTAQMSKPLFTQQVKGQTFATWAEPKMGQFYWQIRSLKNPSFKSLPTRFEITDSATLSAPAMVYPLEGEVFTVEKTLEKLELRWRPVEGAMSYQAELRKNDQVIETLQTNTSFVSFKPIGFGSYELGLMAIGLEGKSPVSRRKISVRPFSQLAWEPIESEQNFVETPESILLSWKGQLNRSYRLNVSERSDGQLAERFVIRGSSYLYKPHKAGTFYFLAEELDGESVTARTPSMSISFNEIPVPKKPEFLVESYTTDSRGSIEVQITNPHPQHTLYFEIVNQTGQVINLTKGSSGKALIVDLMPGSYLLSAYFEDAYRRRSEKSASLKLIVPTLSDLPAPKLKGVSIQ